MTVLGDKLQAALSEKTNDINSYVSTKIESTLGELKGQVIK